MFTLEQTRIFSCMYVIPYPPQHLAMSRSKDFVFILFAKANRLNIVVPNGPGSGDSPTRLPIPPDEVQVWEHDERRGMSSLSGHH